MDSSSHQQNPCLLIADKQTQHQDHPLPLSPLATPTKPSIPAVPRNTSPPPERGTTPLQNQSTPNCVPEEPSQIAAALRARDSRRKRFNLSRRESEEENGGDFDRVGQVVSDLIMWKNSSKSTFWFGFGSLCLVSSCFTQGLNFSIFSALSQLGILLSGVSFFSNSICQRNEVEEKREIKLKEDDISRLAKLILPALNFALSRMRALFSGEPSMTLKVVPFLLLGAEYGHLITIWRLCAIGFLVSFSVPKLYSCYTAQINQRGMTEGLKSWLLDTWSACTRKKKVMASALMAFWNLSSIKTRIFTVFILLVLCRYLRQHVVLQLEDGEAQVGEKEQQKDLVMAELEEKEPQQALVVREQGRQN
ncbi:Reticulon-like protein B17 [Glycine soja]|nr:Reticulon-like protein B17 [Glycine soja]